MKVNYWLYNDNVRVTGLYGAFCQFVDRPKTYDYSNVQTEIVIKNLKHKLERIETPYIPSPEKHPLSFRVTADVLNSLASETDTKMSKVGLKFNQLRIYDLNGKLLEVYKIDGHEITFEGISDEV